MKKLFLLATLATLFFYGCSPDEDINEDIINTENSILIVGISESISYEFTSATGRTEGSIPDDINMIQILILNDQDQVVYEQYHYNYNAYNHYYYDSAAHDGDDYLFENTIPDTLYIPPLADGTYTVLASTAYASYYNYANDGSDFSYPYIESYQVSDAPIFVGKAVTEVTEDTDALVEIDMNNISARIDLNVTSSDPDLEFGVEVQMATANSVFYDFESEGFIASPYDYDYDLYLWRDTYWQQPSFYFLPRQLNSISLRYYDYYGNFNLTIDADIDPDLTMEVGDVFTLNINVDDLIEGAGAAGFNWDEINWNDVGEISIP